MSEVISSIRLDALPANFWDPRLLVGVASAVVLLFGVRLYTLVLVLPGFLVGVLAGIAVTAGTTPKTQAIAALCLGILGAGGLFMVERAAVALVGAVLVAGTVHAVLPLFLGAGAPWYIPAAAAVVGLFLVPRLLRATLRFSTPLLGAIGVAWALGRPQHLPLIGGLVVAGLLFQLLVLSRGRERGD